MKKYTLKKLFKKGIVIGCYECKGSGEILSHGAFGEPEIYKCCRCGGKGIVLNFDCIKSQKSKNS